MCQPVFVQREFAQNTIGLLVISPLLSLLHLIREYIFHFIVPSECSDEREPVHLLMVHEEVLQLLVSGAIPNDEPLQVNRVFRDLVVVVHALEYVFPDEVVLYSDAEDCD